MPEDARLYGMKAVVTGAASGIGEALVRIFVRQGGQVLAVDSGMTSMASVFRRLDGVELLELDHEHPTAAATLCQAVLDRLGGLDILVNNYPDLTDPGPEEDGRGEAGTVDRYCERIADTSGAVLPLLRQSPAGRVINIGFLFSAFAADGEQRYREAVDRLDALTATQAAEFGAFGITCNYVQPGAIMTPSSREVFAADRQFRDYCIHRSAAKRLGEPVDVAKVALFLATNDSVFVSGTGIAVDGGWVPTANDAPG